MNAPFLSLMTDSALVLRVIAGRSKGAEHRLPQGKYLRIGYSFDHDIVLRDASTKGLSFELHLNATVATIRVVAGEVRLLGRSLAAGEDASLPIFVPLMLGAYTIAIGEADSARWGEAEHLSSMVTLMSAEPAAAVPQAALLERLSTRLHPLRSAVTAERSSWPLYGLLAGSFLLVAIAAAPTTRWINGQFNGIDSHKAVLANEGFATLNLTEGTKGQDPIISGIVRDDAELGRLRALVSKRIGRANIDVATMQAMAAAATDMLRAQGIDADARPMRGYSLQVTTEYLPVDRQNELAQLIRRDLPGVTHIRFVMQNSRGDRDLQYFFSGSAFGLATFVDGTPGFIVTADGTRWFAGSQVPTGHKIIAIGNGRASFERDGRVEELVLGTATPPVSQALQPSQLSGESQERT
jgi:type III secretion protein D